MSDIVDIRGIHLGSLSVLLPILRHWQKLNESWEDDVPWWYNERASISFLAGAIWKYGDWVMEELGTEKFSDEKKLEKRTGFCDIAFGINGRDFWGEAKQCWPTLDGKNKTEMVDRNFKVATSQVRAGKERGYEGLAIVVIAPKIKVSHTNWRHIDDYVLHYLKQLQAIPNITLAWTFPGYTRRIRPNNDYWGIYYFPGVILALQPVKPKKS